MHRWWHGLNPIWIGTAIGIVLAILVELIFYLFKVENNVFWISGVGLDGMHGGEARLHTFPAILIVWGFFLGLMVLVRNKAKAWKP